MLFRLLGGNHVQDGKSYVQGNIIKTDRDLCAMFRGKFEKVHEDLSDTGVQDTSAPKKPNIPNSVDKGKGADNSSTSKPLSNDKDKKKDDQPKTFDEACDKANDLVDTMLSENKSMKFDEAHKRVLSDNPELEKIMEAA